MPITNISLRGYIVVPIWWPSGMECYKPLNYSLTAQNKSWSEPGTLREHVLAATNDGDFRSATLAHAELVIERRTGYDNKIMAIIPDLTSGEQACCGGQDKKESKNSYPIREQVADEAANRMLFLSLILVFGLSGGLLLAWMTGWWR